MENVVTKATDKQIEAIVEDLRLAFVKSLREHTPTICDQSDRTLVATHGLACLGSFFIVMSKTLEEPFGLQFDFKNFLNSVYKMYNFIGLVKAN